MSGSPADIGEVPVKLVKLRKGWKMSNDVGEATAGLKKSYDIDEATEGLKNELILRPFRCFTYVTANFLTLPSLHLRRLVIRP